MKTKGQKKCSAVVGENKWVVGVPVADDEFGRHVSP